MQLYKRDGSPKWWVTFNDKSGKRYRRSTGTADRKAAEALAAKWVNDLFLEAHFGKAQDSCFGEALQSYAEWQKQTKHETFMGKTRYRLRDLLAMVGEETALSAIDRVFIERLVRQRLSSVKPATAKRDMNVLRAILNKAHRDGLCAAPPAFPRFAKETGRDRWLSLEEEQRLLATSPPHLKALVVIATETGGRRSELLKLDWKNVDLARGSLTFTKTKNGEARHIRLSARAKETLRVLEPKVSGPVFTYEGKAMGTVHTSFDKARERAGLQDIRFHDLRHTFASRLVQAGIPLYDVMQMTGHKSLAMVQRYAHLAPDFQERAVRALDALGHNLGTVPKVAEGQSSNPLN